MSDEAKIKTEHLYPRIEKGIIRPLNFRLATPKLKLPAHMGSWRDGGKRRRMHYPFEDMDVGDSFFVPHGGRSAIVVAFAQLRRRKGLMMKISTRNWIQPDGAVGIRVWRTW